MEICLNCLLCGASMLVRCCFKGIHGAYVVCCQRYLCSVQVKSEIHCSSSNTWKWEWGTCAPLKIAANNFYRSYSVQKIKCHECWQCSTFERNSSKNAPLTLPSKSRCSERRIIVYTSTVFVHFSHSSTINHFFFAVFREHLHKKMEKNPYRHSPARRFCSTNKFQMKLIKWKVSLLWYAAILACHSYIIVSRRGEKSSEINWNWLLTIDHVSVSALYSFWFSKFCTLTSCWPWNDNYSHVWIYCTLLNFKLVSLL